MKYLVIIILINSFNVFGQIKASLDVDDTGTLKERSIELYYGLMPAKAQPKIFGFAYMYTLNNNFVHSFEFWAFKLKLGDPNIYAVLSTAFRYYYFKKENLKMYLQGGVGMTLYTPIPYIDIGINYSLFFIDVRALARGNWPIYIAFGIKL